MNKLLYPFIMIILLLASILLSEAVGMLNDTDPTNDAKAFTILKEQASQGSKDAGFLLGTLYKKGLMTDKDEKQAHYYYTLAAQSGDVDSMLILAWEEYQHNRVNEAIAWLQEAKALGSLEALELLKELEAL
jgi:TPR repeat protein